MTSSYSRNCLLQPLSVNTAGSIWQGSHFWPNMDIQVFSQQPSGDHCNSRHFEAHILEVKYLSKKCLVTTTPFQTQKRYGITKTPSQCKVGSCYQKLESWHQIMFFSASGADSIWLHQTRPTRGIQRSVQRYGLSVGGGLQVRSYFNSTIFYYCFQMSAFCWTMTSYWKKKPQGRCQKFVYFLLPQITLRSKF